jgi:hypothetical protein
MRGNKAKKIVNGSTIEFQFANGKTLAFDTAKAPANVRELATVHGFSQKIGDSYASAETVPEAIENAEAVIAALLAGSWNAGRSAGGVSLVIEAVARVYKISAEKAKAKFDSLSEADRGAVTKHPTIKAEMARIRLERAEAAKKSVGDTEGGIDLGALFTPAA